MSRIAAVVIGRNEGGRLVNCLKSLKGSESSLVYVDSGSTDDSVAAACAAGAEVVILDMATPFTAARARNAGFQALMCSDVKPHYVQFVDGDCMVVPGWIDQAAAVLDAQPDVGIATGWRTEIHPETSIYNRLCDFEWRRPAGDIQGCGGDMMVRREVFEATGGFDPAIIASEDEEFCTRVRKAGFRVHRLPAEMTRHDADMRTFGQWWRRAVRSGHGFANVGDLHPEYFAAERKRVWIYGAVLPVAALILAAAFPAGVVVILALYLLSYLRTVHGLARSGLEIGEAAHQALFLTLSKLPNLWGVLTYHWRKWAGRDMRIIEYK